MKLDNVLYFSSVNFNGHSDKFWQQVYRETSPGGKFFINLGRRLNPNRFVSRDSSEWSLPWPQEIIPKYAMIAYDNTFTKTFEEVSDLKAQDFARRIRETNEKFAIMYSGGIDSTVIVVSLLKNLTKEELANVSICTSIAGIVENPVLWKNFIHGNFNVIDSMTHKYHDLISAGYTPVTADDGDCIFGTVFGLNIYHNWETIATKKKLSDSSRAYIRTIIHRFNDPAVHYSQFKDLLIAYLDLTPNQVFPGLAGPFEAGTEEASFGQILYDKFDLNCRTASVPVNSLHDFFWWLIFNVKMLNCGVRGALYYNDVIEPGRAIASIENWYMDPGYQQWSMNNNNNGQKIINGPASYKNAAKNYIYSFDKNDYYFAFKLKMESMGLNTVRQATADTSPNGKIGTRFGITRDYTLLSLDDPSVQEYIKYHLHKAEINWSNG